MIQLETTAPITQQASKTCVICKAEFSRRKTETPSRFAIRQTCGKGSCFSQLIRQRMIARNPVAQKAQVEVRYCIICNNELARGKTEGWVAFTKRVTCGRRCAGRLQSIKKQKALSINGFSKQAPSQVWKWIYKSLTFETCVHHFKLVRDTKRRNWEIGTCQKCGGIRDWPPSQWESDDPELLKDIAYLGPLKIVGAED